MKITIIIIISFCSLLISANVLGQAFLKKSLRNPLLNHGVDHIANKIEKLGIILGINVVKIC